MNIYDALLSHLCYFISSWGAIPNYKMQGLFAIYKKKMYPVIIILYDTKYSYDHSGFEFYENCAAKILKFSRHFFRIWPPKILKA